MATINQSVEFSLDRQDRRRLDKLTAAIERLAKVQERAHPPTVYRSFPPQETGEMITVYRDAVSGNYVTEEYALAHPDTTVSESVPARRFEAVDYTAEERV